MWLLYKENDQLLVWGCNDYGQLGVGDTEIKTVPQISISNVQDVCCGINHTLVLSK